MSLQFRAFVFRKKKKESESPYHPTIPLLFMSMCVSLRASELVFMCMCARVKEGGGMRGGITCRNRSGSTKTQHWLDFLIASQPRWMADAAVCANSCLYLRRSERTNRGEGGRTMWDESHAACEIFCNFTTLKNACWIKNHFYWKVTSAPRHISQGASIDAFSMLSGQDRNSVVHYCIKKTKADNVFDFVNVGYLEFTTVEEPGGLKDLMEQSVWISCRTILSTVVLLALSLSLRPCGWLLHIYKSLGMHAYIPEQARWVSLARLITFTSPRPVCSSQMITKHTLRGMIPLVCEFCSYRASAVTPHERAGCR